MQNLHDLGDFRGNTSYPTSRLNWIAAVSYTHLTLPTICSV